MSHQTLRYVMFLGGYASFLIIGATILLATEQDVEREELNKFIAMEADFLKTNPCVDEKELRDLLYGFERASKKGFRISENITSWSFKESIVFVTALATTIGFGEKVVHTETGKIFTMLYAIIAMPLTLMLIDATVCRMQLPSNALLRWLMDKLLKWCRPLTIRILHLLIILSVAVFIIIVPAMVFYYTEQVLNFLDCIFFCVISLTTIGLGDYIPGNSLHDFSDSYFALLIYNLFTIFYLYFGMAYMMFTLTVFTQISELSFETIYNIY